MKRALVIDDSKGILDFFQIALRKKGFFVEVAADGDDGIRKYDAGNFDLVITDINMPIHDGNEVCEHIRKSNSPETPVIAMSGTPLALSGEHFDAVIDKPFSLKALFDQIQFLLSADENRNKIAVYG